MTLYYTLLKVRWEKHYQKHGSGRIWLWYNIRRIQILNTSEILIISLHKMQQFGHQVTNSKSVLNRNSNIWITSRCLAELTFNVLPTSTRTEFWQKTCRIIFSYTNFRATWYNACKNKAEQLFSWDLLPAIVCRSYSVCVKRNEVSFQMMQFSSGCKFVWSSRIFRSLRSFSKQCSAYSMAQWKPIN